MSEATASKAGLRPFLFRGLVKRCPRCGRGLMFERVTRMRERCSACEHGRCAEGG